MYDFAIICGGIVGLSIGMTIGQLYPRARILVLEKENSWALHQSGNNSGVIHSGIYYKPGSDKAKPCRDGNHSLVNFCQDHKIDDEVCSKVIVATDKKEHFLLEELYKCGLRNGLNVTRVSAKEVQEIEPYVHCLAGIRVSTTGIVDYQQVCQKYIDLIRNKGELWLNTKVRKVHKVETNLVLETNRGTFETRFFINCAALYSDRIAKLGRINPKAKIIPFRGEYYELKPDKRYLVKNLIYPVPNPDFPFLGVHAEPNAVLSFKREGYKKTDFDLRDFTEIITYSGLWKLAAKYADKAIAEMICSFSKTAFVRSL